MEKITKAVTPELLNQYVTEQIKPYADGGDAQLSSRIDELSSHVAEHDSTVDSEIVGLHATDEAIRTSVSSVGELASALELAQTHAVRDLSAAIAKYDLNYSGAVGTFCALLRYAFDGSPIIENMKSEEEFRDRGWFTSQDRFIEYNFKADTVTDADSLFDLTMTRVAFDDRAKDVPGMSKATTANYMFWAQDYMTEIPYMNLSSLTSAGAMFGYCSSLRWVPSGLDTSNVVNMNYMFYGCHSLTECPNLPMKSCVSAAYMYADCTSLRLGRIAPLVDNYQREDSYPPVTNLQSAFSGCSSLESVNDIRYQPGKLKSVERMFSGCTSLKSIPYFTRYPYSTTEPVLSTVRGIFQGCASLKGTSYVNEDEIQLDSTEWVILNTKNVTDMSYMFSGCSSLDVTPPYDCSSCVDFTGAFSGCTSLEWVRLTNVKSSLDISASINFTEERLVELIGNLQTVEEPQTLTMGPENLAKLTDEEIAVATDKNWTLA